VAGPPPTSAFSGISLDVAIIGPGDVFGRIYHERFHDPLGFGKSKSRFSDPRRRIEANRFGLLYPGSSLKVCFLEAVLRDDRDGAAGDFPIPENELDTHRFAEVRVSEALKLIDLRGDGPIRMGIPIDVIRASHQTLASKWSVAFNTHPEQVDGIIYPSRLNNATNLAIYDRAIGKLEVVRVHVLRKAQDLAGVLDEFMISIV
jgi:hypothetical protein